MSVFIVIEGGDGSGKSTQIQKLQDWFVQKNMPVVLTREPGSPHEKYCIKMYEEYVFEKDATPLGRLFGFMVDRAEHFAKVIRPSLEMGMTVLCDRCYASTIAYQGYALNVAPIEQLQMLNEMTVNPKPDLEIFLDLEPENAIKRILKTNIFDHQTLDFYKRVHRGYLSQSQLKQIIVNDKSEEQVFNEMLFLVRRCLQEKGIAV